MRDLTRGQINVKMLGALENPQTQFSASSRLFLDQNLMAATMIQNVPKVNKYGGAHDQNVNKYGYM